MSRIESKLIEHGGAKKVIPPADVVARELDAKIVTALRQRITERILREANIDGLVESARASIATPDATPLAGWLEGNPQAHWRAYLDGLA